jgi:hypothetical protein
MPGDPRECRRHALRCAELAVSAAPQQLKAALLELSKNWEQLAFSWRIVRQCLTIRRLLVPKSAGLLTNQQP